MVVSSVRARGWVLSRSANPLPLQGFPPRRRLLARTYRHLDLDERRTLFRLVEARTPVGEIARRLGRHPSTIHRELGRDRFRDGDRGFCGYFPLTAQDLARRRRQRRRKLAASPSCWRTGTSARRRWSRVSPTSSGVCPRVPAARSPSTAAASSPATPSSTATSR